MKKRRVWGNIVNLSGLYSTEPMLCTKRTNYDGRAEIWHKDGDFSVPADVVGPFMLHDGAIFGFAHTSKEMVQAWTDGVKAVMARAVLYCTVDEKE